ncbi:MAG: hypothetical protein PF572_04705 [Patescibacteria group bacterium]|jgi:hypothetical protein|nr:hypothetical protein [Patescibacteria group bacterium]
MIFGQFQKISKNFKSKMIAILFFILLFFSPFFVFAADFGNSQGFAWSEISGWIHFSGEDSSVDYGTNVTSDQVTGYTWSEKTGWISLNCQNTGNCASVPYGVVSDGVGNLSGYAWSELGGWINFSGVGVVEYQVSVDANGVFSGYAWSEKIGWINFNDAGSYYAVSTGDTSAYCETCDPCNPPVLYWNFNSGYGATAFDDSNRGNNVNNDGTISGATWQDESMCVA